MWCCISQHEQIILKPGKTTNEFRHCICILEEYCNNGKTTIVEDAIKCEVQWWYIRRLQNVMKSCTLLKANHKKSMSKILKLCITHYVDDSPRGLGIRGWLLCTPSVVTTIKKGQDPTQQTQKKELCGNGTELHPPGWDNYQAWNVDMLRLQEERLQSAKVPKKWSCC